MTAPVITHRWGHFEQVINDKPAITHTDLGLGAVVPLPVASYRVLVHVFLNHETASGLPDEAERVVLEAMEADVLACAQAYTSIYAGSILWNQRLMMAIYTDKPETLKEALTTVIASHDDYVYLIDVDVDKAWSYYFEVLAPDAYQVQAVENQDALQQMHDLRENITEPRALCHWAYFSSLASAKAFIDKVHEAHFDLVSTAQVTDHDGYNHLVSLSRVDSPEAINPVTDYLIDQAQACHGLYAGWNTLAKD